MSEPLEVKSYSDVGVLQAQLSEKDAEIARLRKDAERQKKLASDAYAAWDADKGSRCGKLLTAMLDDKFCKMYRPDLWPAIDAAQGEKHAD